MSDKKYILSIFYYNGCGDLDGIVRVKEYKSEKAAQNAACKRNSVLQHSYEKYSVNTPEELSELGKKTHKVRHLITGEIVDERIDTPYSCSVSSEAYWSN